ncbi:MAG: DUF6276 family protein [Halorubrum sp.]
MRCPHCASPVVAFRVPETLREHAPAAEAVICSRCLRTAPTTRAKTDASGATAGTNAPDFSSVDPAFPDGEAGVALALLCGQLDSFALNRASIEALVAYAERAGADVFAFFTRLDAPEAAFDLDRRRAALLDLL